MKKLGFTFMAILILMISVNGYSQPKFIMTYCRMLGYYSNHNPIGNHVINVHVHDESGSHLSGIKIVQEGNLVEHARTNPNGFAQITLQTAVHYRLMILENGYASDVSPDLCADFQPYWGHHSYNVNFMRVSDASGITVDPFNPTYDYNPTRFNNCAAPDSTHMMDETQLGTWSGFFAQSFVANTNRIVAATVQATRGSTQKHTYTAQVRENDPNGRTVGMAVTVPEPVYESDIFPIIVAWPLPAVKLTVG